MDRLAYLRKVAGLPDAGELSNSNSNGGGYDSNAFSPTEGGRQGNNGMTTMVTFEDPPSEIDKDAADTLDAFYAEAAQVRQSIDTMTVLCNELKARHSENITTIDEVRAKQLRKDIEDLSQQVTEKAKEAKASLDAINKQTATLKETTESTQANAAIIRIEENQFSFLVARLTGQMAEYQRQQSANEALYKAQTQRQIKIKFTNPDGTQGVDDATAAQLAEQVIEDRMNSYVFQQSKDVLASVIETRNDIYRIEESMRNLNQLFQDLAFLVNEQGEIMDIILANVQAANRYVEAGRKELKKARKYQKKSRKKMFCIICCVVIVVVAFIVIAVVAAKVKK